MLKLSLMFAVPVRTYVSICLDKYLSRCWISRLDNSRASLQIHCKAPASRESY